MPTVREFKAQAEQLAAQGELARARKIYEHLLSHLESTPAIDKELDLYELAGDLALELTDTEAAVTRYVQGAGRHAAAGDIEQVRSLVGKILQADAKRMDIYKSLTVILLERDHVEPARLLLVDFAQRTGRDRTVTQLNKLKSFAPPQVRAAIEKAFGLGAEALASPAPPPSKTAKPEPPKRRPSDELVVEHASAIIKPEEPEEPEEVEEVEEVEEPEQTEEPDFAIERASDIAAEPEPEAAEEANDELTIERSATESFEERPEEEATADSAQAEEGEQPAAAAPHTPEGEVPVEEATPAMPDWAAELPSDRIEIDAGLDPTPPPRVSQVYEKVTEPPPPRRSSTRMRRSTARFRTAKRRRPLLWVLVFLILAAATVAGLQFAGVISLTGNGGTEGGEGTTGGEPTPGTPTAATPDTTAEQPVAEDTAAQAAASPDTTPGVAVARDTSRPPRDTMPPAAAGGDTTQPVPAAPPPTFVAPTPVQPSPTPVRIDSIVVVQDLPVDHVEELQGANGVGLRVIQTLQSGEQLTLSIRPGTGPLEATGVVVVHDTAIGRVYAGNYYVTLRSVITLQRMQALLGRLVTMGRP